MTLAEEITELNGRIASVEQKLTQLKNMIARKKATPRHTRQASDWQWISQKESERSKLALTYNELLRERGALGNELQRFNTAFIMAAKQVLSPETFALLSKLARASAEGVQIAKSGGAR